LLKPALQGENFAQLSLLLDHLLLLLLLLVRRGRKALCQSHNEAQQGA